MASPIAGSRSRGCATSRQSASCSWNSVRAIASARAGTCASSSVASVTATTRRWPTSNWSTARRRRPKPRTDPAVPRRNIRTPAKAPGFLFDGFGLTCNPDYATVEVCARLRPRHEPFPLVISRRLPAGLPGLPRIAGLRAVRGAVSEPDAVLPVRDAAGCIRMDGAVFPRRRLARAARRRTPGLCRAGADRRAFRYRHVGSAAVVAITPSRSDSGLRRELRHARCHASTRFDAARPVHGGGPARRRKLCSGDLAVPRVVYGWLDADLVHPARHLVVAAAAAAQQ